MEAITLESVVPELGRTIPETLGRLGKACFDMYESEDMCRHVLARQQFGFDELAKRAPDESALRDRDVLAKYVAQLTDFMAFLQRHSCMEQLSRMASSRTVKEEIHRFHMDVDSLLKLLGVGSDAEVLVWRQQMASDWKARCDLMKKQLDDTLLVGFELSSDSLMEALTELLYEMDVKTASNSPEHLALMRSTYKTVASMSQADVPTTVPLWFIPSYEVYRLEKQFGAGSFGAVYRGKWNSSQVVVKCLTDAGTRARSYFVNRFSSLTSVRHEHVLRIFGACHVSRPSFVVLEDATGGNFVDFFRYARNKRHMWRLFGEAALGLAYLHKQRVVHGNLRCSNLLVGSDGKARVSDYGFGFIRWESVSVSIKPQTEALRWKALEYFTGECSEAMPQIKADVYSFGMCIIEAMTGQVPWSGIDEDTVVEQLESKIFHSRPAGVFSDKEWELVTQLSAIDKAERIELSAAIVILKELADEEARANETKAALPAIVQLDDAQVDQFQQPSQLQPQPPQAQRDPSSPPHEFDATETSTQVRDTQPKHQQKPASWVASLLQSAIKMRGTSADMNAEAGAGHAEVQVQLIDRHLQRLYLETHENECLLERLVNDFVSVMKATVRDPVTTIAIAATSDRGAVAVVGGAAIASGSFDAAVSSDVVLCLDELYRELLALLERCSTPANVFYRIASSRHVLFEIETLRDELHRLDCIVSPTAAVVVDDSSDGGDGSNGDWVETWDELVSIRDAQLASSLDATRALLEVLPGRASQQEALLMLRYERKAGSDANSLVALALAKVLRWFATGRIGGGSDSHDDKTANDGSERGDAVNDDGDSNDDDDDDDDVPVWFVPRYEVTFDTSKCEPDGTFGTVYHGTWRRRDEPNAAVAVKVLLMHGLGGARSHASFVRNADCWFRLSNAAPVSLASASQPLTLDALKTEVAAPSIATTATEAALVTVSTEATATPTSRNGFSHVLKLLGASHVGQQAFLVLEDAAYGSLLEYIRRETSSSMQREVAVPTDRAAPRSMDRETPSSTTDCSSIVWQLLHQAALGLAHLHGQGVVHGHLRCSNILVASDGTVKLSDFGFDAVRSEVGAMRATDRLRALQWTAPELLLNVGGQPTCSSDVYAFGMCIIEAMTGQVPWSGIDEDTVVEQLESKIFHSRPAGVFSDKEWELVTQLSAIDKAERIELSAAIVILKELADEEARANETKAALPAIVQLDDAQVDQFQQPSQLQPQPPQAQRDPSSPPHEFDATEADAHGPVTADVNASRPHGLTALLLAGRAGHMQSFETLVRAGTPVNVRSAIDGETPLISIARVGHFPAVSLLIAHGNGTGVLCFEDVQDDEYPLLPGSLATMQTMCAAVTFEFEPLCDHMMARLQIVCSAMQQRDQLQYDSMANVPPTQNAPTSKHSEAIVTFACIVYRACRLLFDIETKDSALLRFVASRAILRRINDIDAELSSFARMHGLALSEAASTTSASQSDSNDNDSLLQLQQHVQTRFEHALRSDGALAISRDGDATVSEYDTAVLLQHELALHRREQSSHARASVVEAVLARFLRMHKMTEAPDVPDWFIARDDLEYHSWNLVKKDNYVKRYIGKWRGTSVTIEASSLGSDAFEAAVSQWHLLNHPNIVKLLGACHIGDQLLVYESASDNPPLHEFLRASESNRALTWKLLYDAALGLQYMHNRGVAHGCLQSETIFVGSDKVARLSHVGGDRELFTTHKRADVHWMAPELAQGKSAPPSAAADIFAFGMCVWEAVTLELSRDEMELDGGVLDRPNGMRDSEWELITEMRAQDPSKRVDIAHVVRRLKQFMLEQDQVGRGGIDDEASRISADRLAKLKSQGLDKHYFAELGRTIPKALKIIKIEFDDLPDGEQWLSSNVLPALEFVFGLMQEREMTPVDAEVKAFVDMLGRLQRFVRYAHSDKAVYQQMRSRKVAETHRVVYDELDRLLDMLFVPDEHAIRVWRFKMASSIVSSSETPAAVSNDGTDKSSANAITINHLDTPPAIYEQWTQVGLVKAAATMPSTWRPSWYLSLRKLVFSETDEAIGQGGFGAVYKGKWGDAQVVIKFMGYEDDFDTISTDLMLHEVRVWHRLNHPHVLKLYGACHVDKRYFVCEYASGGELIDYLNKQQPANAQLKWQKLHEAALGLQYLHSMGIAHNDLKGANIMIGADGRAKLIDFGLSALLGEAEIQIAMKSIGAVNWRSPEYLAGGRPSFASDVYAFAMCIIEVVSGELPWGKHMLPRTIKYQQKKGNLPPLPASMTAKQRNLLELMTTFEPTKRVGMAFVVNKLHEIAHDENASLAA